MKIKRMYNESNKLYDYELIKDNNRVGICFAGNLDLYFYYYSKDNNSFIVDKENMTIYNLFDELYNQIKNCKIFEVSETEKELCYDEIELKKIENTKNRSNKALKYKQEKLFIDDKIKWISDDSNFDEDNYNCMIISKEEEKYILNFIFNDKNVYSRSIRISNSGSRYTPFNICFMKFYNNLQKYNPDYHQVDIEEYEYNNKIKPNVKSFRLEYLPQHKRN